jgi:hypothetical protein
MSDPLRFDDHLALCDLKARYFAHVDAKRWSDLRALFADDAVLEGFAFSESGDTGPDRFVESLESFLGPAQSEHYGSSPRFAVLGPDRVRAVWRLQDYVTWEPGSRPYKGIRTPGMYGIRGYGRYEDEFRRTAAGWRISHCRLVRTRIDPLIGTPPVDPGYEFLAAREDWLD